MSMIPTKIDTGLRHNQYRAVRDKWICVRDALNGETAIKAANTRYLPMPAAMLRSEAVAPTYWASNEVFSYNNHANLPYSAYKTRARFPEFTDATLRGIIGLILRNPSAYHNLPYTEFEKDATPDGKTLQELELMLNTEVMAVGRVGILLDPAEDINKPKIVVYKTEDILDWQTEGSDENIVYTGVLLQDRTIENDFWTEAPNDNYQMLLLLDEDGIYTVAKFKNGERYASLQPTIQGKTLDYIPFVTAGTMDLTPDIDSPPMWPLSNLAVGMYQVDADLRNAQYMSCNPMLTLSGVDKDDIPAAIGSNVAMILESYTAKAYYPKTDTSALDHVRMYIKDKQSEAIRLGANLLGNDNTMAESGEAIRLRQSMASATVASTVSTVGRGLQKVVNMAADWLTKVMNAEVLVNKEFSSFQMTANEQIALVQSWQSGMLSSETALENYRRAGMLHEGEDAKAELERIKNDTHKYSDIVAANEAAAAAAKPDQKGPTGGLPAGSQPNPAVGKSTG